ncbi:uncharacterized protein L201_001217 [Kwoniella dendrophila CBS 6074]|uniref:Uncharacterized protein n=1 Tax=Kwoniella dendrophila CBS 6074 TaxID=1295534 RepID=A0AAX4JN74_9TREE
MTSVMNPVSSRPAMTSARSFIRESNFYQEAYLASFPYIISLGEDLKANWEFREIDENDVARYQPFISSNFDIENDDLILNLIKINNSNIIQLIQLPKQLSDLSNSNSNWHARLSTLSTVLTPSYIRITKETEFIHPLNDLILLLQCLLPSTNNALFSSSSSTTTKQLGVGRSSNITCLENNDNNQKQMQQQQEEEEEKEKISLIDSWREIVPTAVSSSDIIAAQEPNRILTPSPKWLDRNEDMLRDTIGCGYYRRLREMAQAKLEDQDNEKEEMQYPQDIVQVQVKSVIVE